MDDELAPLPGLELRAIAGPAGIELPSVKAGIWTCGTLLPLEVFIVLDCPLVFTSWYGAAEARTVADLLRRILDL